MTETGCQLEYSVEVAANRAFVWDWRTDVRNWDHPPAQFSLDGPFAAGSWGTTVLPEREPVRWQIREVDPGSSFIIDIPLDRATLSFEWRFDVLSERRTKLTQRILLSGENAASYVAQVRAGFGSNLSDGMNRIAAASSRRRLPRVDTIREAGGRIEFSSEMPLGRTPADPGCRSPSSSRAVRAPD